MIADYCSASFNHRWLNIWQDFFFSYLKFSLLDHEVTLLISSLEEKLLLQNVSIEFCFQVNFYAWYFHSVPMSSLISSRSLKSLDKLFFFLAYIIYSMWWGENGNLKKLSSRKS